MPWSIPIIIPDIIKNLNLEWIVLCCRIMGPVIIYGPLAKSTLLYLHVGAPGIFSNFLRSVQMLQREWGAESNGKLPHLFIPSKTAALVPEFAVENLPSAELHHWFLALAVKNLPLGRTLWWWWWYKNWGLENNSDQWRVVKGMYCFLWFTRQ